MSNEFNTQLALTYIPHSGPAITKQIVLKGELSEEDYEQLCAFDKSGLQMVAHELNLPSPQARCFRDPGFPDANVDHPFCRIANAIPKNAHYKTKARGLYTKHNPTVELTANSLLAAICSTDHDGPREMQRLTAAAMAYQCHNDRDAGGYEMAPGRAA